VTAVVLVLVCLAASAFFSAAEMAFIAANRIRLRHMAEQGSRIARGYLEAFQRPEQLLSTAMMGVTIAHVSASALTTSLLLPWFDRAAALWATVILTPVMLVVGEILPKALTQQRATAVALRTYDALRGACWRPSSGPPTAWWARSWGAWASGSGGTPSSRGTTCACSSRSSRPARPTSGKRSGR
jgi:Mg2+/Co2+ transporter CorB